MTLGVWKARSEDLIKAILTVWPITELKVKHLKHPIQSMKHSYAFSVYAYRSEGGWDCEGRPGIDCPDTEDFCKPCEFHIYHKPFKPWLGGFARSYLTDGTSSIVRATVCFAYGHRPEDCSTAGPDSGNMDHRCIRCGRYWHVPLY